jgi:UDPglucose 6-dehydrogenase
MNIGVIGCGDVGLGFALLCEKNGHNVIVSDKNENYIYNLDKKICLDYGSTIQRLLLESKFFSATTDNTEVINVSDIIFSFVDTPFNIDNTYDTSNIFSVYEDFLKASNMGISIYDKIFIIGSSTNPGDCEKIQKILEPYGVKIGHCPLFVSKGDSIKGIEKHNNLIIGSKYPEVPEVIISIFKDIKISHIKSHVMSLTASEFAKISINSFLATKISFANTVGEMLINSGLSEEVDIVLSSIGENNFIGKDYFKYGFGYGGPNLTRDIRCMTNNLNKVSTEPNIIETIDKFNLNHKTFLKNFLIKKNPDKSNPFVIDFISYKKEISDIEESQRFQLCIDLLNDGYSVYVVNDNLLSSKLNYINEKYDNRLKFYNKKEPIEGYKIKI